ncbi:hypothetical protein LUZ61_005758 [Rhynchospora tenuis]|uniref:Uncharacterized protein n=1 Tax=Rhynchospora tenuis TaxID=198213 RepID=A0AAD5ZQA6_9POAL|nr:hypothetical protein LUZ61_005758 [Rhynchospora tenuis]
MTINKSQGQSLDRVGVYLSEPVFAHGQLYVALSRTTSPDGLSILLPNGGVIEARIAKADYQRLSRLVEEGRICEIAKFSVTEAPVKYHVVPGDHIIYLTRQTTITPLSSLGLHIPLHYFNFHRLDAVGAEIKDLNKIIDVVGRIAGFSPVKETSLGKPYQLMYLADERGYMLGVMLWNQFLHIFDIPALYEQSMANPVVVICSAVQINNWQNVYGIKAISGTRFYFDKTIPEIAQFAARLSPNLPPIILDTEGPPYNGTAVVDTAQQIRRPEPQTLTIMQFLAVPVDQHSDTLYKCVATITDLRNRYQWYNLELDVRDETGTAKFIALGKIAKLITGIDVDDMIHIQESTKADVPKPLLEIIGKSYQFVVLPKEVPNCPGIRRNTIARLDAVPGSILPLQLTKDVEQAGTSAGQKTTLKGKEPLHETVYHPDQTSDEPVTPFKPSSPPHVTTNITPDVIEDTSSVKKQSAGFVEEKTQQVLQAVKQKKKKEKHSSSLSDMQNAPSR